MQKAAFIFVGTELSGTKAKRNALPFLIFHGETLECISLEAFLPEDLIEQMILFADLLGWDVGCLERPFHQRMWKSQPTGRTSQSRHQEMVKSHLPEELWELLHIWRCQTKNQTVATRTLFPYKKCQHNTLAFRNYQKLIKPLPNQFPPTQQVPALHVLFLFIPRERSGSGKNS